MNSGDSISAADAKSRSWPFRIARKRSPGCRPLACGKGLGQHHLVGAQRVGHAALPQQPGMLSTGQPSTGQRQDTRDRGLGKPRQIQHHRERHPRLDLRHAVDARRSRRPAGCRVRGWPRRRHRQSGCARNRRRAVSVSDAPCALGHHHHHDAATQHQRDGQALRPEPAQVAQQLAVQRPHHQVTSDGATGCCVGFLALAIRPSAR